MCTGGWHGVFVLAHHSGENRLVWLSAQLLWWVLVCHILFYFHFVRVLILTKHCSWEMQHGIGVVLPKQVQMFFKSLLTSKDSYWVLKSNNSHPLERKKKTTQGCFDVPEWWARTKTPCQPPVHMPLGGRGWSEQALSLLACCTVHYLSGNGPQTQQGYTLLIF